MADNNEQATPRELFELYNREMIDTYGRGFDLDVCALPENAQCAQYWTPEDDGLVQPWAPNICWMNPPYSDQRGKNGRRRNCVGLWLKKAVAEVQRGAVVVALLKLDPTTEWYTKYVINGGCVVRHDFFTGARIRFNGVSTGAKFPVMAAIFRQVEPGEKCYGCYRDWREDYERIFGRMAA